MRRKKPLRADPKKQREWQERSRKRLPRRKPLRARNPERLKRLRAEQFGEDGKREWVVGLPCLISGRRGTPGNPVDPAHAGRTRGAGGGPELLVPLVRFPVHRDYDSLSAGAFAKKYPGWTKARVRREAERLHARWLAMNEELGE